MLKRSIFAVFGIVLLGAGGSAWAGLDPDLVGWWAFDEGQGTVANDGSGNNNHGTVNGGALWVTGQLGSALQFNGSNAYVGAPHIPLNSQSFTIAMWINPVLYTAQQIIFGQHESGSQNLSMHFRLGGPGGTGPAPGAVRMGFYSNDLNTAADVVKDNTWYHLTFWYDFAAQNRKIYVNGVETAQGAASPYLGASGETNIGRWHSGNAQWFQGIIDDVQIYHRALSDPEIQKIMTGLKDASLAVDPNPEDRAVDVPRDVVLAWTAGEFAARHDVYFGTVFDDVNTAGRAAPMDVLASQGQTATTYDPDGLLDYGQTYYWRIDEVNAAPDNTIFKGQVWSFTAEPFAYPLTNVTATASSAQADMGPENTVNGSGLDDSGQHSVDAKQMWLSTGVQPNWIRYEFDRVYRLHELRVWNQNQLIEAFVGFGAKDVTVEYSTDGATWTALADVPEFAQANGMPTYAANTVVSFDGVLAQQVRLTINSTWGGVPQCGLAEVQFTYVPVQGREPVPADGATGVSVDTTLDWRPGREATSHTVYFSIDSNAVADGSAPAESVTVHGYTPASLGFGTTYYWRVDEVGEAATYPGAVWSFTTQEYAVVDDFEGYTDDEGSRIYETWIDGYTDGLSGSTVGYFQAPFAEQTIIHGGGQSMPLIYDNTTFAFSEAKRTFDSAQDWTTRGLKTLAVHFAGSPGNDGQLYLKIDDTKVAYDGGQADLARGGWQAWNIDLSQVGNVSSVRSLTIGIEGAGATGTLYIDDIRLYPKTPEYITPVQPAATNLAAHYTFDEGTGTRVGDSSGNANHGTVNGDPQWVTGIRDGAMAFDGAGDFVDCGNGASLVIRDTITVACWIKVASFTRNWETILGMGDDSYRMSRSATTGNSIHFGCNGPTGGNLDARTIVTDDTWHHVALVYDGAYKIIYIDGVEDARAASTGQINASAYNLYIGENSQQTGRYLQGVVDDVRIYSRPLSPAEVAGLAGQTTPRHKPF